jgi:hypothetical protein
MLEEISWDTSISLAALIVSLISIAMSFYITKKYGDVAGTEKMIAYEREKMTEARISALMSLRNEVERIEKLGQYNADLVPPSSDKPAVRLPTAAFETAFVSGESSLAASTFSR